jgi:hypothetical protein
MPLAVLNSSVQASCRHPFWCGSLRTTGLVSTITIIVLLSFRRIIDIGGADGWGRGVYSGRRSGFSVGDVLLMHHLFFIGVAKDDDVVITGRPKKPMVEVAEEFPGELLIL